MVDIIQMKGGITGRKKDPGRGRVFLRARRLHIQYTRFPWFMTPIDRGRGESALVGMQRILPCRRRCLRPCMQQQRYVTTWHFEADRTMQRSRAQGVGGLGAVVVVARGQQLSRPRKSGPPSTEAACTPSQTLAELHPPHFSFDMVHFRG